MATKSKIVNIEVARRLLELQELGDVTATNRKRKIVNRHTKRYAMARFFGLGQNVYQASKETGYPIADLQEEIRRIGQREWERKARGMAA